MPYELSWEPGGMCLRAFGVITDEDILTINRVMMSDPRARSTRYQIADFSDVTEMKVSREVVTSIARMDSEWAKEIPKIRKAIIASTPVIRGWSNVYAHSHEADGGTWETRLFENEAEARAWAMNEEEEGSEE